MLSRSDASRRRRGGFFRAGAVVLALAASVVVPSGAWPREAPAAAAEPAASAVEMDRLWTRHGTGMVTDLATADLDGDGLGEAVVGGRGVGVVASESLGDGRFRWVNKWQDPSGGTLASDGESVQELAVSDLTGDGVGDVVAGTDTALFAIEGGTGNTLWTAIDDSSGTAFGAHEVATGDLNADGTPDVAFAELLDEQVSAVDGTDGSSLWTYARPLGYVLDLASADLNLDGFTDVVVVGQVEAGIEVHAISGLAADRTGVAAPLWVQRFPAPPSLAEARPGSIAIAQIDAGLGPEVAVGGAGAIAVLDGVTGLPRSQRILEDAAVDDLLPLQLDDDADLEMAAAAVSFAGDPAVHSVEAFDADLQPLWSLPSPAPVGEIDAADLDGNGGPEIVVGGGWQNFGGTEEQDGFVRTITADGVVDWETRLPEDVDSLAVGDVFGQSTILAGQRAALGGGGGLFGLDPSGATRWFFRTGGRVEDVGVADIDGDGVAEVIEGAADSRLAVHDNQGALRWQRRVPGKGEPAVAAVAAGDLVPEEGDEIAAGTFEFDEAGPSGRLHLYSASGERLWSRDVNGTVDEVAVSDVDGDGSAEVMLAGAAKSIQDPTGVAGRYDASGGVVWERPVPTGQRTSLSLLDLNADGTRDVILTRASVFHGGAVIALDGATGAELWHFDVPLSMNWSDVTARAEDGVTAGDIGGTVYRLDASAGAVVWQVRPGSASWGGEWSIDADGDGARDVLSASHEGTVRMLSGADGTELWAAVTEGNPGYVVATLRGGDRPQVGVGELGQGTYSRAHLLLLDAGTGERLGSSPTHGPVRDVAAGNLDGDPVDEFVAAAGWQVTAVDALGLSSPPTYEKERTAIDLRVTGNGNERRLVARLYRLDTAETGIAGRAIEFFADGQLIGSATTDADGIATQQLPPRYRGRNHEFEARFQGDDHYLASSSHTSGK